MSCNKSNSTETNLGNGVKFVRVRRITGYLATSDNFNNGKKAELSDRVSHASVNNKK